MSKNNRKKGHDLERQVARDLKYLFPYVKTSRASSKLLDDCGIDIAFAPFLIQCKSGYNQSRPKYEDEYYNIMLNLNKNFSNSHISHKLPVVLIHKLNCDNCRGKSRPEQLQQVTITYDFFMYLLKNINPKTLEQWPILQV